MAPRTRELFFQFGTQYYVAGRSAVFAQAMPVSASILHHAIEMFLKGCLFGTVLTQDESKKKLKEFKREFGHNLHRLWQSFKSKESDPALDRFDDTVLKLHDFQTIRYPEQISAKGLICTIGFGAAPSVASQRPEPGYHLDINVIDSLARALFEHAPFDPTVFAMSLSSFGREYLYKQNSAFHP